MFGSICRVAADQNCISPGFIKSPAVYSCPIPSVTVAHLAHNGPYFPGNLCDFAPQGSGKCNSIHVRASGTLVEPITTVVVQLLNNFSHPVPRPGAFPGPTTVMRPLTSATKLLCLT